MASHLMRSRAVDASSLSGVSYLWRNSIDAPFISEVESFCGIEGIHVSTHEDPLVSEVQAGSSMPAGFEAVHRTVADAARRIGAKVFLTGQGGDLMMGPEHAPLAFRPGTDFVGPHERMAHILELEPEIGSLDCGSLNFDELLYGTTPNFLRSMARAYQQKNVRPELEVFELGHIELAKQLLAEGLITQPALFQLCLGIKYGAPASTEAMMAMRDALPAGARWSAFGLGRLQMPMVAQSVLLGGNVRVGLEDNLYLDKGVAATNAKLVERARAIIELLGARVLTAQETRERLGFNSGSKP